jgi:hypothetical protein
MQNKSLVPSQRYAVTAVCVICCNCGDASPGVPLRDKTVETLASDENKLLFNQDNYRRLNVTQNKTAKKELWRRLQAIDSTPSPRVAPDGDRSAELSNANKSFADRRVTGDPPYSSPRRRAASTQILESTLASDRLHAESASRSLRAPGRMLQTTAG